MWQWYTEVPKLCADDALEVMVYTGPSRVIVPIAILRDPRTGDLLYPSDQLPSHAELKKVKEALIPWDDPLDPVPLVRCPTPSHPHTLILGLTGLACLPQRWLAGRA